EALLRARRVGRVDEEDRQARLRGRPGPLDQLCARGEPDVAAVVRGARLRVARAALLVAVLRILLRQEAELAVGLAVPRRGAAVDRVERRVGAGALRQRIDE